MPLSWAAFDHRNLPSSYRIRPDIISFISVPQTWFPFYNSVYSSVFMQWTPRTKINDFILIFIIIVINYVHIQNLSKIIVMKNIYGLLLLLKKIVSHIISIFKANNRKKTQSSSSHNLSSCLNKHLTLTYYILFSFF